MGLGSYEAVLQRAAAAYRAGKQPAIVQAFDAATLEMMQSGAVLPAGPFLARAGRPVDASAYPRSVAAYYTGTDGLQALPYNVSTLLLYVNLDKLARAGARPPETWEEMEVSATRLARAGEACPFAYRLDPWWWVEQASAVAGAPIASLSNGRGGLGAVYLIDDPLHRDLMGRLLRWSRSGLAEVYDNGALGSPQRAFASGECAMVLETSGAAAGLAAQTRRRFRVAALPAPRFAARPRHASLPGGAALWVMKGQSAAVYAGVADFLTFVQRPEQQAALARATGYLPLSPAARRLTLSGRQGLEAQAIAVATESLDAGGGQSGPPGVRLGFHVRFREVWREEMQRVFAGRQPLDVGLRRAASRGDALLRRFERIYRRTAA